MVHDARQHGGGGARHERRRELAGHAEQHQRAERDEQRHALQPALVGLVAEVGDDDEVPVGAPDGLEVAPARVHQQRVARLQHDVAEAAQPRLPVARDLQDVGAEVAARLDVTDGAPDVLGARRHHELHDARLLGVEHRGEALGLAQRVEPLLGAELVDHFGRAEEAQPGADPQGLLRIGRHLHDVAAVQCQQEGSVLDALLHVADAPPRQGARAADARLAQLPANAVHGFDPRVGPRGGLGRERRVARAAEAPEQQEPADAHRRGHDPERHDREEPEGLQRDAVGQPARERGRRDR